MSIKPMHQTGAIVSKACIVFIGSRVSCDVHRPGRSLRSRLQVMGSTVRQRVRHLRLAMGSSSAKVLVLGLAITACAEPTVPADAIAVGFQELQGATRSRSKFGEPQRLVLRRASDFSSFWSGVQGESQEPALPDVDFAVSTVVAAALGARGSTGFEVRVEGVFVMNSEFFVVVRERRPGGTCVTGAAITNPVTAIVVDELFEEATFVEEVEVYECG